jgi:UDP-2,3-diacylglucosamine pyrophosphatase LpxH
MTQHPAPLVYRSVFISDVHLGYHGCRAEMLLDFLHAVRTEHLYLVGDIVDLQALRQAFHWPQAHSNVLRALLGKAKHGTRIVYVPGNHDAAFREYCGLRFGNVEVRRRCLHTTVAGKRYLVTHGDEFDVHVACSPWLEWAGSMLYRRIMYVHSKFNGMRLRMGYPYWSLASFLKERSGAAQRYIERFKSAVARSAGRRRLDGVICGHIHRPDTDVVAGVRYLNDGDWVENCTALVEHTDGRMELVDWPSLSAGLDAAPPMPARLRRVA